MSVYYPGVNLFTVPKIFKLSQSGKLINPEQYLNLNIYFFNMQEKLLGRISMETLK